MDNITDYNQNVYHTFKKYRFKKHKFNHNELTFLKEIVEEKNKNLYRCNLSVIISCLICILFIVLCIIPDIANNHVNGWRILLWMIPLFAFGIIPYQCFLNVFSCYPSKYNGAFAWISILFKKSVTIRKNKWIFNLAQIMRTKDIDFDDVFNIINNYEYNLNLNRKIRNNILNFWKTMMEILIVPVLIALYSGKLKGDFAKSQNLDLIFNISIILGLVFLGILIFGTIFYFYFPEFFNNLMIPKQKLFKRTKDDLNFILIKEEDIEKIIHTTA